MARVFIDGFESGSLDLWDIVAGAAINNTQAGRDGNYCVDCVGQGSGTKLAKKILPSPKGELFAAIKFYPAGMGRVFTFYNGTTKLGYIQFTAFPGYCQVVRGDGTVLATGTNQFTATAWHLIELHYKPAASGGVFEVKLDGILDISFTGNTTPGATTVDGIQIGHDDSNWPPGYFDDVVIDDAAWVGNTKIQAIQVNGTGSNYQFTPSAGLNWQNVDEIPYSEADYNDTTIAGKIDTHAHAALSGAPSGIKCFQVQARGKLIGNPTTANLKLAVSSGGVVSASSAQALGTTSKGVSAIFATDPNTGVAWTPTGVNAAEIGYQSA